VGPYGDQWAPTVTSGPPSAKISLLGQTPSYATDQGERLMKETQKSLI